MTPEEALADAAPEPYWLDRPQRPEPSEPLTGIASADLVIVGAGFTGLWAAVQAKEDDPGRDVLLVDGHAIPQG